VDESVQVPGQQRLRPLPRQPAGLDGDRSGQPVEQAQQQGRLVPGRLLRQVGTDGGDQVREEVLDLLPLPAVHLGGRLVDGGVGAVALPVDLVLGVSGGTAGLVLARYGTAPLVALGLLALVVEVVGRRERPGRVGRRLAEVGRMALSSYVLQNVVASALCYGWGLGLASRLDPAVRVPATVAVYLVVVAVVVAFAHLWLRRFARGPVEWLWHASYRKLSSGH
jgi:Protein of unknown function (DUF418)